MDGNSCCFSGHRVIPVEASDILSRRLDVCVDWLHTRKGVTDFYAGGCTGFDTIAEQAVLKYRETHPAARLIIVIPYRNQASAWSERERMEYDRIKAYANEVICLSERYFRGCMHQRNRYMVDHSSVCVCYLTRKNGGTAFTVKYAQSKGLSVCNLASENFPEFCQFPSTILGGDVL